METTTITVVAHRKGEALKDLEKLARKARRYGNPDITVSVGETSVQECWIKDWDGAERKVKTKMVDLIVSGEAPTVGNHEFLARIELGPNGNMVDTKPGVDDLDPKFRHSTGSCDHCRHDRRRKDVYVVRDLDTGEQLQIGRTCLRDYLGIDSPSSVTQRFAFWKKVTDSEGDWGPAGGWAASLEGMLTLAATCVRLFGWCSKGQANADYTGQLTPTASYVSMAMTSKGDVSKYDKETWQRIHDESNESDLETAQVTIAWVRGLDPRSDYEHNLVTCMQDDCLHDPKRIGLVISAVSAHARAVEKELRRTKEHEANKASQWVGKEKDRLRGIKVTKEFGRIVGGNAWGDTVLIKFRDEAGNVYSWFTNGGSGLHDGEQATIDGTVKTHSNYAGNRETQLTRVRVH